ncbi:MAG: bifunctional methylenetetrahydrofolate dehydrogenase/methenyltetrahydrofolate cyclohydrolase FolD [Chitinivibrionales bacterium]|nr:bifunctional methylenetetrahydrofolate dehydrogenase/methenyltetrahydrofolate cyclohydrolase FolD [Chitinivibrionales bacterium]MBD3355910.1 bifunctional methylenetetrahydrofolate dehydrogenase/methenyltetrahydrofolate cyclohydrolase FolD [Chitinivibrionales bacterium]
MAAKVIDGKQVAAAIRAELKLRVEILKAQGVTPGLGVILVGDDPASQSYVKGKHKACAEIGIYAEDNHLPTETGQEELRSLIDRLNNDPRIHGILLQLPLPRHLDEKELLVRIDPDKDVDGFHPMNVGKMVVGEEAFLPCTPHGIVQLLMRSGVTTEGAHAVVVGRSNIVGKPIANMLIQKKEGGNATVTVCHTRTKDIGALTRQADIIIAAAGRPGTITADMVKEGAVVIDVGVNRVEDASRPRGYRLVGDVDFETVKEKAALITPVPGGVGPMTITMLMVNTVESAQRRASRS